MTEEERLKIEAEMREKYSCGDDFSEEQKKDLYRWEKVYPTTEAVVDDSRTVVDDSGSHFINDEEPKSVNECPYGYKLNDEQKTTYRSLVPRGNPAILFTLLLGIIGGIIIIIFYTVYKNQKINEFNERFYGKYVEGKEK